MPSGTVAVPSIDPLLGHALGERDGAALLGPLAGAGVGAGALAAHGQALAMPRAAVAAEVHQPLDAHGHFAAEVALDAELAHLLADLVHLGVREILDLGRRLDARRRE